MRWMPVNSSGCSTNELDPKTYSTGTLAKNGEVTFAVATPGVYVMCYQWKHAAVSHVGVQEFVRLPAIKLLLVDVDEGSILPRGSALDCPTNVTIIGTAFDALPDVEIKCSYGPDGGVLASELPLERNDSFLLCQTPAASLSKAGTVGLYLSFGSVRRLPVLETFSVEDLSTININSALPAGGKYNTKLTVTLRGSGFKDLGGARCKFGDFLGDPARVIGSGLVKCPKPAFPDSERAKVGSYPLSFSPNGQCYATATSIAANANSVSTFTTYNAFLKALSVTGAPANTEVEVGLIGSGFPNLPGGLCLFTRTGHASILRNATVTSTSTAVCPSPRGGVNGAVYALTYLLNGVSSTPTMAAVGGTTSFTEYDLSKVRISSIFPPGGPMNELVPITIRGTGFASYGDGQLLCEIKETGGRTSRIAATLLGTAGDTVVCSYFTPPNVDTNVQVRLSLNNGTEGTFVADAATFTVYQQPTLKSITPKEGDANGGNEVTIVGSGFMSLAPAANAAATRTQFLRCKFADEVQPIPPKKHNDTAVICTSTRGKEDPAGQPVSIALNAFQLPGETRWDGSFFSSGDAVKYVFKGLNKPALIESYFPSDANSLVLQFDPQPTNRANMNGQLPCSLVLSDATVAQVKGSSPQEPKCEWMDDSKMKVLLDLYTNAAPGMTVGLKKNVLWPKAWAYPGSCEVTNSMCSPELSVTVSTSYPCDIRDTPQVEACVKPIAYVQAPEKISSCPGTPITLVGSNSQGGGIKPLSFYWSAHPTKSDNYYNIQPAVSALSLVN